MDNIRKLLAIIEESSAGASSAGGIASVATSFNGTQKRVEESDETPSSPEVMEYGNWENSALSTTSKLKKNRNKSAKVVKSIYGDDKTVKRKQSSDQPRSGIAKKDVAEGKEQNVDEGWKEKLAGAALAGTMALGAAGAHARVVPGQEAEPGINRLTGKPNVTQAVQQNATQNASSGYSVEYLQKAADPNRVGRYMISVEKAQELLNSKQSVDESDISGILGAARLAKDFIVTAEVDGKVKKFKVRGVTGPNAAKERFLRHASMAKVLDVKEVSQQGVAEGSESNDLELLQSGKKTSDGIGMQDIRLMAGEGPLTKKTVRQAIEIIRKQRRPQGVAEGYDSEELANEVYSEFERIYPSLARRANERTIHAAIMDVLNYGGDSNPSALAQDVARAVKQDLQGVAEGSEEAHGWKIGKMYRGAKEPYEVCYIDATDEKTALAKAHHSLKPNHMQILKVMRRPQIVAEDQKQTFTVVYYSPKTDRNVTKTIRANNEAEVWDKLKAKDIDVVSVKQQGVEEGLEQELVNRQVAYWDQVAKEKKNKEREALKAKKAEYEKTPVGKAEKYWSQKGVAEANTISKAKFPPKRKFEYKPFDQSLITDPEEYQRLRDQREIAHVFGDHPNNIIRARNGMMKKSVATPRQWKLLFDITTDDGGFKPRMSKGHAKGVEDKQLGEPISANPFDPVNQPDEYKDYIGGWKSINVSESNDYFRRREREEGIIAGTRQARKKKPNQTSDYAKRREDEKKSDQRIDELSTEKLAQYKKAAGIDASQSDKKGDFSRGNKRFSGIVKATKKQFANDEKRNKPEEKLDENDLILNPHSIEKMYNDLISKSSSRTDHEVEMAKGDLFQAGKNAVDVYKHIRDVSEEEGLEGWIQEKITKAADYLNTVREYLDSKQVESIDGVSPGTHMFASESTDNNKDTIEMDIPFLIRALEYAREDAKGDLDLHNVVEHMIDAAMKGKTLTMQDYITIFGKDQQGND